MYVMCFNATTQYIDFMGMDAITDFMDKHMPDRDKSLDEGRLEHIKANQCIGFVGAYCDQKSMASSMCFDTLEKAVTWAKRLETDKLCCHRNPTSKPVIWVLAYKGNDNVKELQKVDPEGKAAEKFPEMNGATLPATANNATETGAFDSRVLVNGRAIGIDPQNGELIPADKALDEWKKSNAKSGKINFQYCVTCSDQGEFKTEK